MLDTLTAALVEPFARRWSSASATCAAAFWLTGFLSAILSAHQPAAPCSSSGRTALLTLACHITARHTAGPILGALAALAAVAATAGILAISAEAVFDLLVGRRWPAWPGTRRLALMSTSHHRTIRERMAEPASAAAEPRARYAHGHDAAVAPTALGNRLLALSRNAWTRYGLDLQVAWNPLVAVLDQSERDRIEARAAHVLGRTQTLVTLVAGVIWAIQLPVVWACVGTTAIIAAAQLQHRRVERALADYADAVMLTLLLRRRLLYTALAAPAPPSTQVEREYGVQLSSYLRGHDYAPFDFDGTASPGPPTAEAP